MNVARVACVAVLAATATVWGCGPSGGDGISRLVRERAPRDVLLITIDTLRHDATGFSGAGRVATPHIDRLAAEGVVFSWTHAHAVITLPSHASILTGLHPHEHGLRDNAGFVLGSNVPTLATVLRERGYATAAFVSAAPLDRRFGLDRGFDVYDDDYDGDVTSPFLVGERPDAETIARAGAWWTENAGQRRFLWLHVFGPHFPYEPTEPFASRHPDLPYLGDVEQTDARLGELLTPLMNDTGSAPLVVLTSDHGESLGEHGEFGHGVFAYEPTLRVPLLFWAPEMLRAAVHEGAARHVDLLPTILDLLALDAPDGLPGRRLFAREDEGLDDACYFESLSTSLNRGWAPLYGRIEGERKAIQLPLPELYDLRADPGEATNLVDADRERFEEIVARLPDESGSDVERGALDPEVAARLRSLGYVAGAAERSPEDARDVAKDPKNLIGVQQTLNAASRRYRAGEVDAAIGILEDLAARYPDMPTSYSHLSQIYLDHGRDAEAVRLLETARSRGVDTESMRTLLALAHRRAGRLEAAWEVLAADEDSPRPTTQWTLARLASDMGRPADARRRYERALALDPTLPQASLELGLLHFREQRFGDAVPHLEQAVARLPEHARGWNALGVARVESGDLEGAIAAWEAASRADPGLPDPLFNLAQALARSGDTSGAAAALERYLPLVDGARRDRAQQMLDQLRD